jgi:elongation factor G
MGELHLDILVDRMKREFKVEVNQGEPQVEYKEALQNLLNIEKHTRNNLEVVVNLVISYLDSADEVDGKAPVGLHLLMLKGGNVPKEYIPSVEKVLEKL